LRKELSNEIQNSTFVDALGIDFNSLEVPSAINVENIVEAYG